MDGLGAQFVMPSFESFCERLTREKSELCQNDVTKSHALVATPPQGKGKGKKKNKPKTKSNETPAPSSKEAKDKKERPKCGFCKKERHSEQNFYRKENHELKQLLKEHNIFIPSTSNLPYPSTKHEDTSPSYKGKGHALITAHALGGIGWIVDSRASVHIAHSPNVMVPGTLREPYCDRLVTANNQFVHVVAIGNIDFSDGLMV